MSNDTQGSEKKGNKRWLIIIIVILLLGGGFAYLKFYNPNLLLAIVAPAEKEPEMLNTSMDEFVVNLADRGYGRYLKTSIVLEYIDEDLAEEIAANNYIVRDAIINLLSSRKVEQISTVEGKKQLKQDLIAAINKVLKQGEIKNLFWTDFVIQ